MRSLKILVVVMGVLIVAGVVGLIVALSQRVMAPAAAVVDAVLEEPAGTHIAGISTFQDRLVVQLQGGGTDRVVIIDLRTGHQHGRVRLAR